ncbi:MAG: alpha/beta hydrolase [Geodermatophilaceae bacterium]|nr:alpha/beta hydrolase [Geodermatophilaceae bacterium]
MLVHGAWHGAWAWETLLPHLATAGLNGVAVSLPSSGGEGDLAADAHAVRTALEELDGPAVLVGHSYGGIVISEAATAESVRHLVYLSAYLLPTGSSLLDALGHELPYWIRVDEKAGVLRVHDAAKRFYGDVAPGPTAAALQQLTTQTLSSFRDAQTRAAWERIASTYLVCDQDRAVPPQSQHTMSRSATNVGTLHSSHSPFLSQPARLAAILTGIIDAPD